INKLISDVFKITTHKMSLNDVYYLIADHCASLMTFDPIYNKLASRISIERLHKATPENYEEVAYYLFNNKDINGNHNPLISNKLYKLIKNNKEEIQKVINYNNDYLFDYFGIRTLERSYLFKIYNFGISDFDLNEYN